MGISWQKLVRVLGAAALIRPLPAHHPVTLSNASPRPWTLVVDANGTDLWFLGQDRDGRPVSGWFPASYRWEARMRVIPEGFTQAQGDPSDSEWNWQVTVPAGTRLVLESGQETVHAKALFSLVDHRGRRGPQRLGDLEWLADLDGPPDPGSMPDAAPAATDHDPCLPLLERGYGLTVHAGLDSVVAQDSETAVRIVAGAWPDPADSGGIPSGPGKAVRDSQEGCEPGTTRALD